MRNTAILALILGLTLPAGATPLPDDEEQLRPEAKRIFEDWDASLRFEGFDLGSLRLENGRRGLEIEGGYLNPSLSDPLLGKSPYLNLTKRWSSTGRFFDLDTGAQIGVLDLESRYGPGSGYESSTIFLGSILSRAGRAYNLFGPLDVGWSTMGLFRMTDKFPNLALDQSLGARVRLGENSFLGYFTGVTVGAARMTRDWTDNQLDESLLSPHQGLSLWGRLPDSETDYSLSARTQDNPLTQVENITGSLTFPSRRGPISLFIEKDRETGGAIEFDRERTSIGVGMRAGRNWDVSATYGRDEIQFGNVETESKSLMLKLKYSPRKKSRGTVTVETLGGGGYDLALPPSETADIVNRLNHGVMRLQQLLDLALARVSAASAAPEAAQALIDAIASLDPELRAILEAEFGEFDQSSIDPAALQALLDEAAAGLIEASASLQKVADFLADPRVIDKIAARYARAAIYEKLAAVQVDLFGKTITLSPPRLIAFAHAYGMGVDPILPVTEKNIQDIIRDECGGEPALCLLSGLPEEEREQLAVLLGDNLLEAVGEVVQWAADTLRREMNTVLLQVYLAAERLDRLSIDRGRRLGGLNQDALKKSFAHLDERRAQTYDSIYPRLQKDARIALAGQQQLAAGRLRAYGSAGLERLMRSGGWPKNVEVRVPRQDWPALITNYGQKDLYLFFQECALKVATRGSIVKIQRLEFMFDPESARITRADTTTVSLPPAGRDPKKLLDILLGML